jgi:hypothetical protein
LTYILLHPFVIPMMTGTGHVAQNPANYVAHFRQQCHNSKFVIFQEKCLKVLIRYNFLREPSVYSVSIKTALLWTVLDKSGSKIICLIWLLIWPVLANKPGVTSCFRIAMSCFHGWNTDSHTGCVQLQTDNRCSSDTRVKSNYRSLTQASDQSFSFGGVGDRPWRYI